VIYLVRQTDISANQKATMDDTWQAMFTQTQTMQGQLEQMKKSTRQTDKLVTSGDVSANAAKSAADTSARALEVSARPWVAAEDIEPSGSLIFNQSGATIPIRYTLRNYGSSPALGVQWRSKLISYPMRNVLDEIRSQQAILCKDYTPGRTAFTAATLFPGSKTPKGETIGDSMSDIETNMRLRDSGPLKNTGYVQFAVIGCIDYRNSFGHMGDC
jgi:hypothetical protein